MVLHAWCRKRSLDGAKQRANLTQLKLCIASSATAPLGTSAPSPIHAGTYQSSPCWQANTDTLSQNDVRPAARLHIAGTSRDRRRDCSGTGSVQPWPATGDSAAAQLASRAACIRDHESPMATAGTRPART